MTKMDPSRRRLLRGLSATLAPFILPCGALIPKLSLAAAPGNWQRMLILVELQGGNDGLNTLVPYRDDAYRALRPTLGLPVDQLVTLTGDAALHNALTPLVGTWEAGELAIVQGIGYERPNHSHFRSIEIWDAASTSDEVIPEGWVSRLFAAQHPPSGEADGVIFGRPVLGPLLPVANSDNQVPRRFVVMDSVKNFTRRGLALPANQPTTAETPALQHLLATQAIAGQVAQGVAEDLKKLDGNEALEKRLAAFPQHGFGKQCAELARLLAADSRIAVAKLSLGGFDTHVNQLGTHARLLGELASGLAALRAFAKEQGVWDRLVIASYSEFGRRAGENKSAGTDHGTAAPHFVLGGNIAGGLKGEAPSLTQLQAGDLIHTMPMQRYIGSLAKETWGLTETLPALDRYPPLRLIA